VGPLGHTNIIVWIAGEQEIFFSSEEGKNKNKILTSINSGEN
jgi:hypothetical protein